MKSLQQMQQQHNNKLLISVFSLLTSNSSLASSRMNSSTETLEEWEHVDLEPEAEISVCLEPNYAERIDLAFNA